MSLTRVSSLDGSELGLGGRRDSVSHRRISFSPVSDWAPNPKMDRKMSVVSLYTHEEVSKGKRIGETESKISLDCPDANSVGKRKS